MSLESSLIAKVTAYSSCVFTDLLVSYNKSEKEGLLIVSQPSLKLLGVWALEGRVVCSRLTLLERLDLRLLRPQIDSNSSIAIEMWVSSRYRERSSTSKT